MSQINRKDDSTGAEQGLFPFALINRRSDNIMLVRLQIFIKIMPYYLAYIILFSPILWLLSLFFLHNWKHFWKFAGINFLVITVYSFIILSTNLIDYGHDEYGLGPIVTFVLSIVGHIILGFIFSIGYKFREKSKLQTQM